MTESKMANGSRSSLFLDRLGLVWCGEALRDAVRDLAVLEDGDVGGERG